MTYPLSKRLDRERKLLGEKKFSELWQVGLQKTAVKYRLDTFSDVAPVLKENKYNHSYHICFNAPFSQWMSVSVLCYLWMLCHGSIFIHLQIVILQFSSDRTLK